MVVTPTCIQKFDTVCRSETFNTRSSTDCGICGAVRCLLYISFRALCDYYRDFPASDRELISPPIAMCESLSRTFS